MLAVDGSVGADNRRLDIAKGRVDPLERRLGHCRDPASGLGSPMGTSGIGDAGETLKPIADDRATWAEAALGERRQCLVPPPTIPAEPCGAGSTRTQERGAVGNFRGYSASPSGATVDLLRGSAVGMLHSGAVDQSTQWADGQRSDDSTASRPRGREHAGLRKEGIENARPYLQNHRTRWLLGNKYRGCDKAGH